MGKIKKCRLAAAVQLLVVLILGVWAKPLDPGSVLYSGIILLIAAMSAAYLVGAAIVLLTLNSHERDSLSREKFDDFLGTIFMVQLVAWVVIFLCSSSEAIFDGLEAMVYAIIYFITFIILVAAYSIQTGMMHKRTIGSERS